MSRTFPKRGEVHSASLDPAVGREFKKTRPVVVVSNDHLNEFSDIVIIVPITSGQYQYYHDIPLTRPEGGLKKKSIIVTEQVRAIDQSRLVKRLGRVKPITVVAIERAIRDHFNLPESDMLP